MVPIFLKSLSNFLFRSTFKFMLDRVIWLELWIFRTKFFRWISTQNYSNLCQIDVKISKTILISWTKQWGGGRQRGQSNPPPSDFGRNISTNFHLKRLSISNSPRIFWPSYGPFFKWAWSKSFLLYKENGISRWRHWWAWSSERIFKS